MQAAWRDALPPEVAVGLELDAPETADVPLTSELPKELPEASDCELAPGELAPCELAPCDPWEDCEVPPSSGALASK